MNLTASTNGVAPPVVNSEIRKLNKSRVFQLFLKSSHLSRRDIQSALGLSLPTVSSLVSELLNAGLICKTGNIGNTGGRKAETFSVNARARFAVGVDITRHHVTLALVDLLGHVVDKSRLRCVYEKTETYLNNLKNLVRDFIKANEIPHESILGVGLGIPALTDIDNTKIVYAQILDLQGMTAEDFSRVLGFPVKVYNDANAACYAELYNNKGENENGFYIMLSNNVGGAVFINHSLFIGENFRSGEVGHLIIHKDGKPCYCGQRGCLDPYCSATVLAKLTNDNLESYFELLATGDKQATVLWEEYLQNLAIAIRSVRILFDCPIIIGGYVGGHIDNYMPKLYALLDEYNTFDNSYDFVKPCRFKVASIAAGAALGFVNEFLESI